jgi:hypothetical protein
MKLPVWRKPRGEEQPSIMMERVKSPMKMYLQDRMPTDLDTPTRKRSNLNPNLSIPPPLKKREER